MPTCSVNLVVVTKVSISNKVGKPNCLLNAVTVLSKAVVEILIFSEEAAAPAKSFLRSAASPADKASDFCNSTVSLFTLRISSAATLNITAPKVFKRGLPKLLNAAPRDVVSFVIDFTLLDIFNGWLSIIAKNFFCDSSDLANCL